MNIINVYPAVRYQTFDGFGGALTEASAFTWAQMPPEKQDEILEAYFGLGGIGYRFVRMAIDSCDFSLGHYSAVEDPSDTELKSFSLKRDEQYIFPFLRAAEKKLGRKIPILLSPWSPPAFMKTNGERDHGGKLKPEYRQLWADYICRYIAEYQRLGFDVRMLTVQNEPDATQIWDSCRYDSCEEKEFVRDYLFPSLQSHGLGDVELLIWDHNKERAFERATEEFDPDTRKMISGVAFHWYSGEHFDALRMIREKFPEKKLVFTEGCVEYSRFSTDNQLANARMYAHDIMGNLNNGANASFDWNIVLDEHGGPNHVKNYCDAPVMCDTAKGTFEKKLSHTYIGHFSKYILPDAVRIGTTRYTDELDATAFSNPDGSAAVVLLNRTSKTMPVNLRIQNKLVSLELPPDSIATAILR